MRVPMDLLKGMYFMKHGGPFADVLMKACQAAVVVPAPDDNDGLDDSGDDCSTETTAHFPAHDVSCCCSGTSASTPACDDDADYGERASVCVCECEEEQCSRDIAPCDRTSICDHLCSGQLEEHHCHDDAASVFRGKESDYASFLTEVVAPGCVNEFGQHVRTEDCPCVSAGIASRDKPQGVCDAAALRDTASQVPDCHCGRTFYPPRVKETHCNTCSQERRFENNGCRKCLCSREATDSFLDDVTVGT
jgi:hypothetical protein